MKTFLIVVEAGEGCDYSLHCGTLVEEIEAESGQDAFEEFLEQMDWLDYHDNPGDYDSFPWDHHDIEYLAIYEVRGSGDKGTFRNFVRSCQDRADEFKQEAQEVEEQKELQRLAKKLGKTIS